MELNKTAGTVEFIMNINNLFIEAVIPDVSSVLNY